MPESDMNAGARAGVWGRGSVPSHLSAWRQWGAGSCGEDLRPASRSTEAAEAALPVAKGPSPLGSVGSVPTEEGQALPSAPRRSPGGLPPPARPTGSCRPTGSPPTHFAEGVHGAV